MESNILNVRKRFTQTCLETLYKETSSYVYLGVHFYCVIMLAMASHLGSSHMLIGFQAFVFALSIGTSVAASFLCTTCRLFLLLLNQHKPFA